MLRLLRKLLKTRKNALLREMWRTDQLTYNNKNNARK
ncbi:hypothetical protein UFOVP606_38 [uncultured Caudovirales phage]|uniref:Uncharacterized protein n=1 Tax=uncultured Caudovirales phage TaxID=2100421 RepID=A0A6J5N0B4_9CAUD|nr:hypothetical protein UFOVP606_38 [uncultured Caudovirales phage]